MISESFTRRPYSTGHALEDAPLATKSLRKSQLFRKSSSQGPSLPGLGYLASTPTLGSALARLCLVGALWLNSHEQQPRVTRGPKLGWEVEVRSLVLGEPYSPSYVPLCTHLWMPGGQQRLRPFSTPASLSARGGFCTQGAPWEDPRQRTKQVTAIPCAGCKTGSHTTYGHGSEEGSDCSILEGTVGRGTREKGDIRG